MVVLFAYILAGVMCGFAGLLYAARVGTVTLVVLASGWELTSLAAAVLGGVSVAGGSGSVIGAALGASCSPPLTTGSSCSGIPEFWRMFVQGSAIVLAVAVDVVIGAQIRGACPPALRRELRTTAPEHVSRLWRPSAWEAFLVIMILVAGTWSSLLSPYYLSFDQILYSSRQFLIPGLLALGLMVVVVTGEIDISLASTLGGRRRAPRQIARPSACRSGWPRRPSSSSARCSAPSTGCWSPASACRPWR